MNWGDRDITICGYVAGFVKQKRKRLSVVFFPAFDVMLIPEIEDIHIGDDWEDYLKSQYGGLNGTARLFYEIAGTRVGTVTVDGVESPLYKTRYFYVFKGGAAEYLVDIIDVADLLVVDLELIRQLRKSCYGVQ